MATCAQPRLAPDSAASWEFSQRRGVTGAVLSYGLLLLFLVLLYSQLPMLFPQVDAARPVYMVGAAAIATVLMEGLVLRRGYKMVWPESQFLLGFLAIAAISCIGALWKGYAVENTLVLLKATVLYFLIVNSVHNEQRLRKVLWVMVLGGLFPAIGTLLNFFGGHLVEGRAAWIGIFANPNELAYSLTILIPLAAYLAGSVSFKLAPLFWIVISIYLAAIFLSFSRSGFLGLLVVLAMMGLRQGRASTLLLMALLIAASVAFVVHGWSRNEGFAELGSDVSLNQRLGTMRAAVAMFMDHPLTGVGLGCSVVAWPLYAPPDVFVHSALVTHNTPLQTLSETGIVGFLCFSLFVGWAVYDARKIKVRAPSDMTSRLSAALEISLWGFVICGLAGGFALSLFPYILIGLISVLKKMTRGTLRPAT